MDKPTLHAGRLAREPRVLGVRALTREDLACLQGPRAPQGRIKKFRNTHHRLAKYFAAGLKRKDIATLSGLSYTRLATYHNDPAFQELIAQYQPEADAEHAAEVDEFLSLGIENMIKAERMLGEHLDRADDEDALLPVSQLLAISSDRADRFGYSKQSRQTTEVVDFAKIMEANMARMGKATVIDAEPVNLPPHQAPEGKIVSPHLSPSPPEHQSQHVAGAGLRRRV